MRRISSYFAFSSFLLYSHNVKLSNFLCAFFLSLLFISLCTFYPHPRLVCFLFLISHSISLSFTFSLISCSPFFLFSYRYFLISLFTMYLYLEFSCIISLFSSFFKFFMLYFFTFSDLSLLFSLSHSCLYQIIYIYFFVSSVYSLEDFLVFKNKASGKLTQQGDNNYS